MKNLSKFTGAFEKKTDECKFQVVIHMLRTPLHPLPPREFIDKGIEHSNSHFRSVPLNLQNSF